MKFEMSTVPSRIRLRDVVVFALVACAVALVVVLVGRETGVGEPVAAGIETEPAQPQTEAQEGSTNEEQSAEPLILTLFLRWSDFCETVNTRGSVPAWIPFSAVSRVDSAWQRTRSA